MIYWKIGPGFGKDCFDANFFSSFSCETKSLLYLKHMKPERERERVSQFLSNGKSNGVIDCIKGIFQGLSIMYLWRTTSYFTFQAICYLNSFHGLTCSRKIIIITGKFALTPAKTRKHYQHKLHYRNAKILAKRKKNEKQNEYINLFNKIPDFSFFSEGTERKSLWR